MHFQTSIDNWPNSLKKMPNGALIKSVNDPSLLREARQHWASAGRDLSKLWTDYRHHDLDYYFSTDFDQMVAKWRINFRRFIDATYIKEYAPHVLLVEELNEYTDTRMVTDKSLLAPRLTSAQAAVSVWNKEYRGRTLTIEGNTGTIPSNCRLVICNSPVGNDVPREFYQLSVNEDAPLGVHPYTHWINKARDPQDFRYHSGRWHYNEQQYGIKPNYVFTESSPYGGVLEGWRHQSVCGGDRNLLIEAMRLWFLDLQSTPAYSEGRILGPGAWFTSSRNDDQWGYYRLWESELTPIADLAMSLWKPGTTPPPPPPPDPDPDCYGLPREQYHRVYHVIPSNTPVDKATEIFARLWTNRPTTVGPSYDDAGIGSLQNKEAVLHLLEGDRHQEFLDWYSSEYPGTIVRFENTPQPPLPIELHSPVAGIPLQITHPFNEPRDYDGDGIKDDRHEGIDIRAVDSSWNPVIIIAPASGAIEKTRVVDPGSGYGKYVLINHGNGFKTWLAHLSEVAVNVGQVVQIGDVIGLAGTTGNSTGVHLHLTLQWIGNGLSGYVIPDVVDPTGFIVDEVTPL